MIKPARPPIVEVDDTQEVNQVILDGQPIFKARELWPLRFTVVTYITGSKVYIVEFRPFMKWAISVTFFWKA